MPVQFKKRQDNKREGGVAREDLRGMTKTERLAQEKNTPGVL
jgi:hypothetical protein